MTATITPRLRSSLPVIAFGFGATFLSSPGQTFFVAVFNPSFSQALGIGPAQLGTVYMAATLSAAALLPLAGKWIDQVDLRLYVTMVLLGLAAACALTAATVSVPMMFAAFMTLRLCGQGLMSHTGTTSIARYFHLRRGRALSAISFGYPAAEAITPAVGLALIAAMGWRGGYLTIGLFLLVVALPLMLWLLRNQSGFTAPPPKAADDRSSRVTDAARILFGSAYFWIILPVVIFLPFTSTALVFHVGSIADMRGWTQSAIALGFIGYAVGHVAGLLAAGHVIDRFTGVRTLTIGPLPFAAGLVFAAFAVFPATLFVVFAAMGLSAGLIQTALSAMWVEVFGTARIGAIRSLAATFMVASTAAGPAVAGFALEAGAGVAALALALAIYGSLAAVMALGGLRALPPAR